MKRATFRATNTLSEMVDPNLQQSERESRLEFLLFIKILFKCLKETGDELLSEQARLLVYNTKESLSNPLLRQSIIPPLRVLVGDMVWCQAQNYFAHYVSYRYCEGPESSHGRPGRETTMGSIYLQPPISDEVIANCSNQDDGAVCYAAV